MNIPFSIPSLPTHPTTVTWSSSKLNVGERQLLGMAQTIQFGEILDVPVQNGTITWTGSANWGYIYTLNLCKSDRPRPVPGLYDVYQLKSAQVNLIQYIRLIPLGDVSFTVAEGLPQKVTVTVPKRA